MEVFLLIIGIVTGIFVLFFAWFFLGSLIKILFLWGPSIIIVAIGLIFGFLIKGVLAAIIILAALIFAYPVYEKWEESNFYTRVEKKLSSIFHFE